PRQPGDEQELGHANLNAARARPATANIAATLATMRWFSSDASWGLRSLRRPRISLLSSARSVLISPMNSDRSPWRSARVAFGLSGSENISCFPSEGIRRGEALAKDTGRVCHRRLLRATRKSSRGIVAASLYSSALARKPGG